MNSRDLGEETYFYVFSGLRETMILSVCVFRLNARISPKSRNELAQYLDLINKDSRLLNFPKSGKLFLNTSGGKAA
jgi:hypothetical protein